ncbi:hypothetical protein K9M59_00025 [Candidatus Gracilibacteria bacterium]|nr:hypothetical protein [Candidatus Gracilibacteria bacterium]MCF7818973.1 hypothetical protein [Candidatus Gracilibacteria bacterium]
MSVALVSVASIGIVLGYGTNRIDALDDAGLSLFDNDSNGIFIQDGGNVGIGTTAPTQALDVNGRVRLRANGKGTCDADAAGAIAYEETANVGYFYGCKKTGEATYQWFVLEIFGE